MSRESVFLGQDSFNMNFANVQKNYGLYLLNRKRHKLKGWQKNLLQKKKSRRK